MSVRARPPRPRLRVLVIVLVLLLPALAAAADLVDDAREYRATLQSEVEAQEKELARARETAADRKRYRMRGIITEKALKDAEHAVTEAAANVRRAQRRLREADEVITEAMAADALWAPPTPGRGGTTEGPVMLSGVGAPWSREVMARVERFFESRFGRALPVSARGQTPVHDRLGLDHSRAVDVAVHPASAEGQALIRYLTKSRVAYLAFRSASPGAATGAHIHIGTASPRRRMLSASE